MYAIHSLASLRRGDQLHIDVNAANYQDAFLRFYFTEYVRAQLAITCIDLTRFQRAPKSAHHSTSG